ncbi:MAG: universal stress protein [Chlorobium sp.]|jgi:nucleotide-binding universal stress UspA family protein|nr:universal stress protein [Chlorobium sp.]
MQEIRHIIVPVDFHTHSDAQANFALYMAKILNAKTTFIHVMRQLTDFSDYEPTTLEQLENNLLAHAKKKMAEFMRKLDHKDLVCDGEVLSGNVAETIIAYTKEKNADMIVISTHGTHGIEKMILGSVAERVIKGADCPCLVFNPFKKKWRYDVSPASYTFDKSTEVPPLA